MSRLDGVQLRPKAIGSEPSGVEDRASAQREVVEGDVDRPMVGSDAVALWTIDEVSAYLRVPVGTLYQWRVRGEGPPALRLGSRHLRFSPESVRAWALAQPAA